MSEPTTAVRVAVYNRDGRRCVACGETSLSFQHRAAVGMGGSRIRPSVPAGLTLCGPHNEACEHEMQTLALARGWKIRRWADPLRVPVYFPHEFGWFELVGTERHRITSGIALDMMLAVYGDQYLKWRDEVGS